MSAIFCFMNETVFMIDWKNSILDKINIINIDKTYKVQEIAGHTQ